MRHQCNCLEKLLLEPGKKFRLTEAKKIEKIILNRCEVDTRSRFHNRFFHEIRPLLKIAKLVADGTALVSFTGINSSYDGMICFQGEGRSQKVELTVAIDGHNDALMMEHLDKYGYAPAFERIKTRGSKQTRVLKR